MENTIIKSSTSSYFIIRILDEGMSGYIYLCKEKNSKNFYVLKEIKEEYLEKPSLKSYFENEINIHSKLKHKNIVTLKENSKILYENKCFIVMEYCNGRNLYHFLNEYKKRGSTIPEIIIQFFFKQLCEGLKYLHDNNIIHRDLKLENILLNYESLSVIDKIDYFNCNYKDCTIKICDFGLSKKEISGVSFLGTPFYIAPEVISNKLLKEKKHYSQKVDIWGLGIILYELITGKTPFEGISNNFTYENTFKGVYYLNKNIKISSECLMLINSCLRYNPINRLSIDQILLHPFFHEFIHLNQINLLNEFNFLKDNFIEVDCIRESNSLDVYFNHKLAKNNTLSKAQSFNIELVNEFEFKVIESLNKGKICYKFSNEGYIIQNIDTKILVMNDFLK